MPVSFSLFRRDRDSRLPKTLQCALPRALRHRRRRRLDTSHRRTRPGRATFAPHRPRLLPLLAKNFGRGRDRKPAVEVARCPLHSATRIAAHPDWRTALAVRDGSDHRVLKLPAPIPTDRLSGPEGTAQPHAFENPPDPFFERYADCGEFGVAAREIRTDTK